MLGYVVRAHRTEPGATAVSPTTPSSSSASLANLIDPGRHCCSRTPTSLSCAPRPRDDADAHVIDYVTDDPSFSSEQPDVGAQEPDATVDAYYYVETADDQE